MMLLSLSFVLPLLVAVAVAAIIRINGRNGFLDLYDAIADRIFRNRDGPSPPSLKWHEGSEWNE